MQDLVSLAVHRGAAVLWCQFFVQPADRDRPEGYKVRSRQVDVYQRRQVVGDPAGPSVDAHEVLFTLADLPYEELVPRWFKLRKQFGATCNMLLGMRYLEGGTWKHNSSPSPRLRRLYTNSYHSSRPSCLGVRGA
jgi:hypothetical protein